MSFHCRTGVFIKGIPIEGEICDMKSGHLSSWTHFSAMNSSMNQFSVCSTSTALSTAYTYTTIGTFVWIQPASFCVFTGGTIWYNYFPSFFFTRVNLILYLSYYTAVWCNKKCHLSEVDAVKWNLKQCGCTHFLNMVNFILSQVQQFDCSGMKSQDTKFPLLQNGS